jgi:hypothetical protein
MGKMHVLPRDAEGRQPCLPNEALPLYYMSDHSVVGILVREFDEGNPPEADKPGRWAFSDSFKGRTQPVEEITS